MSGVREEANTTTLPSALSATSRSPAPPRELEPGQELLERRFLIERILGRGGMGLVYAALDRARGETVALKMLQLGRAPAAISHLKREFRALSDLAHPNLVRLHELFLDGEHCFFTMDLIEGVGFSSYLRPSPSGVVPRSGAMPTTVRSELFDPPPSQPRAVLAPTTSVEHDVLLLTLRQLALGVSALHAEGKLHRDLKPSNVLVTPSGRLSILDFGLVLDEPESREAVQRGEIIGTPLYMAPELFAKEPASPASDWFAVGVMLYEALTGAPPFPGGSALTRLLDDAPRAPSELAEGVPPELEALCLGLLQREPSARPPGDAVLRVLGARLSASLSARSGVSLIGRETHLGALNAALADGKSIQKPVVVFLSGVSGMGKSALLEHFVRERRASGSLVLLGRCYERESVPHKAFDEVVDALTREVLARSGEERWALLPEHTAPLAQLFPVLRQIPEVAARWEQSTEALEPRELRRRGYRALGELLSRVAGREPLVIGIDDLHWGDLDSARLLVEMLTMDQAPPCLIVASYRSDEVTGACLTRLLHGEPPLSASVDVRKIEVDPLEPEQARVLAASLLTAGDGDAAQRLDAVCLEAHGNPLLLRELASHDAAGGNVTLDLRQVVRARLAQLSPGDRRVFELLCVAGQPLATAVIAAVADAPTDIPSSINNLRAERLLRERTSLRPDALDVFHDRIRVAALAELDADAIRVRHGWLAAAYERTEPSAFDALARHHAGAGQTEHAARFAELAGDAACAALAFNRAVDLYRQVLELAPERARSVELKLAVALSDAGRGREAAPLFMAAAAHVEPKMALEYRRRAAEQWLVSGHLEPGLEALEAVLGAVKLRLPRTPRSALFDLLFTRARLRLRGLSFRKREQDQVPPNELLRTDACKASWPLSFVNTIQGAAFQARFLEQALKAGEPSRVALGLCMEGIFLSTEGGKRERRIEQLRESALALNAELSDPQVAAFERMLVGQTSYMFGRWQRTSEALEAAEKIFVERCRAVTWELNSSRFFWANALIYQGRWREIDRRTQAWLDDAADRGDVYASASLHLLRTRCLGLAADEPERALRDIDSAMAEWRSPDFGVQRFLAELSRIQVALYCGEAERAVSLVERLWPAFNSSMMQRIQLCRIHCYHHSAYALLASAATSAPTRLQLNQFTHYARLLDKEGMPWASAFAVYIRAASSRLMHELGRAERGLRDAAEAFDACNMVFYSAACRYRLGQMLGDRTGRALIAQAEESLRAQGIVRPDRIFAMMAPGFPTPAMLPGS